jgi:hypothetical protein
MPAGCGGLRWAARGAGLGCWAAAGWVGAVWFSLFFLLFHLQNQIFSKPNNLQTILEFKPRFESNNQKQCTSMYATVNSYISLIN